MQKFRNSELKASAGHASDLTVSPKVTPSWVDVEGWL